MIETFDNLTLHMMFALQTLFLSDVAAFFFITVLARYSLYSLIFSGIASYITITVLTLWVLSMVIILCTLVYMSFVNHRVENYFPEVGYILTIVTFSIITALCVFNPSIPWPIFAANFVHIYWACLIMYFRHRLRTISFKP